MKKLISMLLTLSIVLSMLSCFQVNAADNSSVELDTLPVLNFDRYTGNMGDSGTEQWLPDKDKDLNGNTYVHGLIYRIARWNDTNETSWAWNEYNIGDKYKSFSGMLTICGKRNGWGINENPKTKMFVYGDGKLIYTSNLINRETSPQKFSISISGIKILKVEFKDIESSAGGTNFGLVEPMLSSAAAESVTTPAPAVRYKIFNMQMTWEEAKEYCESIGGHLVTITSENEQEYLKNKFFTNIDKHFWIGGFKNDKGVWEWVTGEPFVYNYWNPGEPNNVNGVEDRLNINYEGSNAWNDAPEEIKIGFICEFENVSLNEKVDPNIEKLLGSYTGSYTTNGGTGLLLDVTRNEYGQYQALFSFFPLRENPNVETGSYIMNITYDSATKKYSLNGVKWVKQAKTYVFADMLGLLNGNTFKGDILGPKSSGLFPELNVGGEANKEKKGEFTLTRDNSTKVYLNGKKIDFTQPVVTEKGSTLVPVNDIFGAFGATVDWNAKTKKITVTTASKKIVLTAGSDQTSINGKNYYMEVPARVKDSITMVSLKFAVESLGAYVEWNGSTKSFFIYDSDGANLISRVKAYTTTIPNYKPTSKNYNTPEFKAYTNAGSHLTDVQDYKNLINNDMYVAYQFEQYAKNNLAVQASMSVGKTVFNGDAGDYLILQSPEKERFKKMLVSYMKDTAEQNQIEYAAAEFIGLGTSILESVKDLALKKSAESKVAYDTIAANLKYFNNPDKTLDGMADRVALIVEQEEILKRNGIILDSMNGIDSNAVKFLETKYNKINNINNTVKKAAYTLEITTAGVDAYRNITEIYGLAATYEEYAYLLDTIIRKSTNNSLRAAAYELQTEINSKLTLLVNETHKVLGKTLLATGDFLYSLSVSSVSDKVLGSISSSVSISAVIGTLASNVGFGTADMLDAATYTIGYSQISQILTNELKALSTSFNKDYAKSYEYAMASAGDFYKCYETLRQIRISGEQAYLSMRAFDGALLKDVLRDWTNFETADKFCNDSIKKLNGIVFKQ